MVFPQREILLILEAIRRRTALDARRDCRMVHGPQMCSNKIAVRDRASRRPQMIGDPVHLNLCDRQREIRRSVSSVVLWRAVSYAFGASAAAVTTTDDYTFEHISDEVWQELDQVLLAQALNLSRTNGEYLNSRLC